MVDACSKADVGFCAERARPESTAQIGATQRAVLCAQKGDMDAFRWLYTRYRNNVYGYACSITRDEYEAEDVTQHVFLKLITTISKYDPARGLFSAWLTRFARNVALDHVRARREWPSERLAVRGGDSPEDIDRSILIRAVLASLPADQRRVVLLRHVKGATPGQIAEQMGRTEASIHALHHRGRATLQHELQQLGSQPSTHLRAVG